MARTKADSEPPVLHRGIGPGPTKCKGCPAMIVFAIMPASGRPAPFVEDPAGTWILENGVARHVGAATAQLELGKPPPATRYKSHFADCPAAQKFRSKRDG